MNVRKRGAHRGIGSIALLVVLGALLSACGSSSNSSSSTATAGTTGAASTTKTAAAKGKVLCSTPLVKIGAGVVNAALLQRVAKDNGLTDTEKVANGDLNAAVNNIQSCARAGDTAAIVSSATDNNAVKGAIAAAAAAKVPYFSEFSGKPVPGQTFAVATDEADGSKLLADYAAKNLGEKLNIIMIKSTPLPTVNERVAGFLAAAKAHPNWKVVDTVETDLKSPAEGTGTLLQASLRSHPETNLIVAPWDDPAAGAVAAINQSGKKNVKVLSYDGVEPTWAGMRAGSTPIVAVAGQPSVLIAGVVNRELKRVLAGQKAEQQYVLCRGPLVTKANVPAKNQPLEGGTCSINGKAIPASQLQP